MQKATVDLAGRTYEVEELGALANSEWRQALVSEYGTLLHELMGAINTDYDTPEGLSRLGSLAGRLVFALGGSIEDIRERVLSYSPVLTIDRERLLAEGYDSEFLEAFVRVIQLAYPFGGLTGMVKTAIAGVAKRSTLKS